MEQTTTTSTTEETATLEETTTLIEYQLTPDMGYLFTYVTESNLNVVFYILFFVISVRLAIGFFKNIS